MTAGGSQAAPLREAGSKESRRTTCATGGEIGGIDMFTEVITGRKRLEPAPTYDVLLSCN